MLGVAASETSAAQTDDAQWPAGLCVVGVGRPACGTRQQSRPSEKPQRYLNAAGRGDRRG